MVVVLGACAPAPLAGACLQPPHPWSPDAGGGVFHSNVSGPHPRFFLLFRVRPSAFFFPCGVPGRLALFGCALCPLFVRRLCGASLLP